VQVHGLYGGLQVVLRRVVVELDGGGNGGLQQADDFLEYGLQPDDRGFPFILLNTSICATSSLARMPADWVSAR
jgi:hypothetical protein